MAKKTQPTHFSSLPDFAQHIQPDMTLREAMTGTRKGKKNFPNADQRQDELIDRITDAALQLVLENILAETPPPSVMKLAETGLIKPHVSEKTIRAALSSTKTEVKSFQELLRSLGPKAVAKKLKHHDLIITSKDIASPNDREKFWFDVHYFRELTDEYRRSFTEFTDGMRPDFFASPPKRPIHPCIRYINSRFGVKEGDSPRIVGQKKDPNAIQHIKEIITLNESGPKSWQRANEKIGTRSYHPKSGNLAEHDASGIYDINRAAIIPASPEQAERFCEILKEQALEDMAFSGGANEKIPAYRKTWEMRASGYFDSKYYITLNRNFPRDMRGMIAEIMIIEKNQFRAYKESHRVYDVMRHFMKKEDQFDPAVADERVLSQAEGKYHEIMEQYRNIDARYATANTEDFRGFHSMSDISAAYENLLRLHQSLHTVAARDSSREWQSLYLKHAIKHNMAQRGNALTVVDRTLLKDINPKLYSKIEREVLRETGILR